MISLWKKFALVPPLLLALWFLVDDDEADEHDLAVVTALGRHRPSLRVYRALLELTLLLFCAALSLFVWERSVGNRVVGILLFQPPQDSSAPVHGKYRAVAALDDESNDDEDADGEVFTEEEALDAQYDSDGEVEDEPTTVYAEPPTGAAVASAALDLLLLVLLSLFLFTISSAEGGRYIEGMQGGKFQGIARIAAPVFPLALFVLAVLRTFFPFQKRKDFWTVVSYTVGAPLYEVTFRDGFIGDILTSSVRPMQDLAFTVFYILSGLKGWWTQAYDLDDAHLPVEKSWLLHTTILPACMVSPLWWRFLQNLRQAYEHKKRWPYLGNALKYFVAAQVAMMGLFDPSKKENALWILCFVLATLYQTWWDVFMDWELLEFRSNGRPKLRSSRLYPSRAMYLTILVVNVALRFCWTLSFLPRLYLNQSGTLLKAFDGRFAQVVGPAIASAEIMRRTLWGFLRLELEAIKTCHDDPKLREQLKRCSSHEDSKDMGIELKSMAHVGLDPRSWDQSIFRPLPPSSPITFELKSDMSARSDLQILGELCLWATAFASLGLVAAAHRETL